MPREKQAFDAELANPSGDGDHALKAGRIIYAGE